MHTRPRWAALALLLGCASASSPPASTGGAPGGDETGGAAGGRPAAGGAPGTGGSMGGGTGGAPPVADAAAPDATSAAPAGTCAQLFGQGAPSAWVYYDASGKLAYKTVDERGDRIMDFSHAGYMGGGVALPKPMAVEMVKPSGGDDTAAIQAAIDAVARRPLVNGFRGAVLLAPGQYRTAGTLNISASGVALRGSGSGDGGSEVAIVGSHLVLKVAGGGTRQAMGPAVTITDPYVPVGARSFRVAGGAAFEAGDAVLVNRPVTAAWRTFMGMGDHPRWLPAGSVQSWERTVTAVDGDRITIDVPIPDSLDGKYVTPPGASLQKYAWEGRISQVGIEALRFRAPKRGTAGSPAFLDMTSTIDSWVSDVEVWNTVEGLHFSPGCRRITATRVRVLHDPSDSFTEAAPSEWTFNSSEVLIDRSASKGALKIMMVTTLRALGPNVVLDFDGEGPRSHIQPHMYWATGLLVDRSVVNSEGTGLESAIAFINRGHAGSDHGWALGWGVAWNCTAPGVLMQKPPGSMAWAIGCKTMPSPPAPAVKTPGGALMPPGIYESVGTPVAPGSLYLAQLCERLGPQALAAIGH